MSLYQLFFEDENYFVIFNARTETKQIFLQMPFSFYSTLAKKAIEHSYKCEFRCPYFTEAGVSFLVGYTAPNKTTLKFLYFYWTDLY